MEMIVEGLDEVVHVIEDILAFGCTQEEHDHRLNRVLGRLSRARVRLNRPKCVFSEPKVKFLGVTVSANSISPDPNNLKALANWEAPVDVISVRKLLGMANHVGRFLPACRT